MKPAPCVALALALVLGSASVAWADDGRIGGEPGAVRIVGSTDIRMESETVQAHVYGSFAEYLIDFAFMNSGPEQEVRLGFPFGLDDKSDEVPPVALAGFLAYQDGTPLTVTLSEGTDGPAQVGWFEHSATFPRGKTMIRVRYVTRPSVSMGLPDGVSERAPAAYRGMAGYTAAYTYTLHTGAGWSGTIGRAVTRFSVSPDLEGWDFGAAGWEFWGTRPAGFSRPDATTVQWVFEDFEPTPDVDTGRSVYDITAMYCRPLYQWADYDPDRAADPTWAKPWVTAAAASSVSAIVRSDGYPRHPADAAVDGDPSTSWISATSTAAGAWLRLDLAGSRRATELRIVPGHARTPAEYREHGRPKHIEIRFPDGSVTALDLADEPTVQHVALPGRSAAGATITVTEVYPGTAYDDVAIAEVEIGSAMTPAFLSFEEALAADAPVARPETTATPRPSGEASPGTDSTPSADTRAAEQMPAWLSRIVLGIVIIAAGIVLAAIEKRKRPKA